MVKKRWTIPDAKANKSDAKADKFSGDIKKILEGIATEQQKNPGMTEEQIKDLKKDAKGQLIEYIAGYKGIENIGGILSVNENGTMELSVKKASEVVKKIAKQKVHTNERLSGNNQDNIEQAVNACRTSLKALDQSINKAVDEMLNDLTRDEKRKILEEQSNEIMKNVAMFLAALAVVAFVAAAAVSATPALLGVIIGANSMILALATAAFANAPVEEAHVSPALMTKQLGDIGQKAEEVARSFERVVSQKPNQATSRG